MLRDLIKSIRIRPDRAEILKEKAYELSIASKTVVKETDIVNYLIDEYAEYVKYSDASGVGMLGLDNSAFPAPGEEFFEETLKRMKKPKTELEKKMRNKR